MASDGGEFPADATNKFARWFDAKYGVEWKKNLWIKCHAMVGGRTNVVVACEVNDAHDSKMFHQLLATTSTNFRVDEASADKGYLSFDNLALTEEYGATPFIAFKLNSKGDRGPSVWRKMHAMFTLNREQWLSKYHLRSNVESTFSAIKRKFGDAVRSKTDVACTTSSPASTSPMNSGSNCRLPGFLRQRAFLRQAMDLWGSRGFRGKARTSLTMSNSPVSAPASDAQLASSTPSKCS